LCINEAIRKNIRVMRAISPEDRGSEGKENETPKTPNIKKGQGHSGQDEIKQRNQK
jgi:hypothetical protein